MLKDMRQSVSGAPDTVHDVRQGVVHVSRCPAVVVGNGALQTFQGAMDMLENVYIKTGVCMWH